MPLGSSRDILVRLPQLFERAPGLVLVLSGPEHRIEYANPAYLEFVQHRDLVGLTVREALPDLAGPGVIGLLDRVFTTGEPRVGEGASARLPAPTGEPEERHFDFAYQPILGETGEPIGVFVQGTDVTARVRAEQARRESDARLERATRATRLGIWDWRLDTGEMIFDARARALWGFPAEGPITREMLAEAIHPDDEPETTARFKRAIDPAVRENSPYEYRVIQPDGTIRWVRANAEAVFEDLGSGPVAVRYVGAMTDVTAERRWADELRQSENRLRLAIDAGRMAVWALDANGNVEVTPEFNRLLGLEPDARPSLEELRERYYPGELERLHRLGRDAMARGQRYMEVEYRHRWPDDSIRWLLVRAELLMNPTGQPLGAIGVVMDITERRENEERLKLLAREVDHRANNLLSVVQGIVTLTEAETVAGFKDALLGRVAALAHAHNLIASSRWLGADLQTLLEEELRPYADPDRVSVRGAAIALSPALAQGISLAVHELATNAVKYGALSRPSGRLEVSWTDDGAGQAGVITWREEGGPPVHKPERRGMGTRLLERALSGPLGGRTELDWRAEGLVCRLYLSDASRAAAE